MQKFNIKKISASDLLKYLESNQEGLSSLEAQKRLKINGPNIFYKRTKFKTLKLFIKQFKNSLVYLLIIACVLSFLFNSKRDGVVIIFILIINTSLSFYQEYRSEKAVDHLSKLIAREIMVLRDQKPILVFEKDIVVGDIVILKEGDIVPADIRLIESDNLAVNESQLSGESLPVNKDVSASNSLVYAGSIVENGEARGVVYATSFSTELGKIAHLSINTKRTTQFEKSLNIFSNFLIKVTSITLLIIFILKLVITHDLSNIANLAIFIVALLIAVVPEAMPVIVTLTLSKGALKLSKKHVIVKTLSAVEDLGNINILCSDKTGTLTENKLHIKNMIASDLKFFQILAIASLEASDEKKKRYQSAFDNAFLNFVPDNIKKEGQSYKRLKELPFDPDSRRRRVIASYNNKIYLIEVGSVETLLSLTKDHRSKQYHQIISEEGKAGLRHLGIAYKELSQYSKDIDILKNEVGLKFVGFVSLEDPLRKNVRNTIKLAEALGVEIKIMSGDSKEVTEYVAKQVGLLKNHQRVYSGEELTNLSDSKLIEIIQNNNTFARLNPTQKHHIIELLKIKGNVVGYQGDGINDAPALKLADVAIAVNGATDVAKDSADIVLLRDDIGVIINGVKSGREIFANINKYIRYVFVSNWGNFFALSLLYIMSIVSLPIFPVQVLLTSLITELPCFTIATDNVDTVDLQRPSKFNIHSLMFISIFLGSITSIFEIMYYAIIKQDNSTQVVSTGLYIFLTFTALIVILSIRNKGHFFKAPKFSKALALSFLSIFIISLALVYIPYTKGILLFANFPLRLLLLTAGMTFVYFVIMDTVKVWFYKTNLGLNLK